MTHVALMSAATASLYALSLAVLKAPCWALFFFVAVTAYPIWRYRREQALFERRALLAGLTHEASRIRRWFWSGRVSGVLQVFAALVWATLLLAFASLLDPLQWLVLAVGTVVLGLLIRPVTAWLARDVRDEHSGIAARRWPLAWINIAILGLAFFAIDFFVLGAPDTRAFAWHELGEGTLLGVSRNATCPLTGVLVGGLKAADALAWHAAEILIPSLPNQGLKAMAWMVFLLQAGVIAIALTRVHLGLVAWLDRRDLQPGAPAEPSRTFLVTTTALFAIGAVMAFALRDFDASALATRGRQLIAWGNPCRTDSTALAALRASLDAQLRTVHDRERSRAIASTDAAIDALFAPVEKGVEDYLDWYFSVAGEYQRLGSTFVGKSAESMREELERRVFGEGFSGRLEQASREIAGASHARIAEAATAMGAQLKSEIEAKPCLLDEIRPPALRSIERDIRRTSTAAAVGVVAGASVLLARRAATAAATKAASKRAVQGAAALAGRTVTKRAASSALAAGGAAAVCGPFALLCAIGVGTVTWLTVDKALVEIDELRFRDEMRKDLLESLRAQKDELASQLRALHEATIDQAMADVRQSVQRVFVPAREGL